MDFKEYNKLRVVETQVIRKWVKLIIIVAKDYHNDIKKINKPIEVVGDLREA
jgi:hypothetical protein